jgi:geranyl-CoA carboxylase alpha subunit
VKAMAFQKILIANRGEIACRVIRTAQAMGYRTVAVYSDADAGALHVRAADEAVRIGAAPVGESYLDPQRILEACRVTGADAVHPGYGFLSENAGFAEACAAAGVVFIGPPAPAIALMGSKRKAKIAMAAAGVPCVPGYDGEDQSDATLTAEAVRIGFPVMVKASAGGGGRGMRLVHRAEDLAEALRGARAEALSAFGSGELILERALIAPRHVELQVFADSHGAVIHLGERDCSVQRRHQKVIEEAPSPFVTPELRAAMGAAAVEAARACGYVGAGTVEFLVDAERNFYFLEMNTRLQVEHPVTEEITSQDLVAWQIAVAAGAALPLAQDEVRLQGWAMEARLYAEDPGQGFLPQTGRILAWEPPEGVRVDHGIAAGDVISPFYDPMIAKVISHGATRDEARRRLVRALEELVIFGVTTNADFLTSILRHPEFADGAATTALLSSGFDGPRVGPGLEAQALAMVLIHERHRASAVLPQGWRNAAMHPVGFKLDGSAGLRMASLLGLGNGHFEARSGEDTLVLEILRLDAEQLVYRIGSAERVCRYVYAGDVVHLTAPDGRCWFRDASLDPPERADTGSDRVIAPMDGAIVAVKVVVGDVVVKGQTIAVLEAMKMEHQLVAATAGRVVELVASQGAQVKIRQVLARIEAEERG